MESKICWLGLRKASPLPALSADSSRGKLRCESINSLKSATLAGESG